MEVRIYTLYDDVVIELLQQAGLLAPSELSTISSPIVLENDEQQFEWRTWIAAAMSCGLIEGGYVR